LIKVESECRGIIASARNSGTRGFRVCAGGRATQVPSWKELGGEKRHLDILERVKSLWGLMSESKTKEITTNNEEMKK